jgi:hypothetical protein
MQHFDQRQILLLENAYYQVSSSYSVEPFHSPERCSATRQSELRDKRKSALLWNFSSAILYTTFWSRRPLIKFLSSFASLIGMIQPSGVFSIKSSPNLGKSNIATSVYWPCSRTTCNAITPLSRYQSWTKFSKTFDEGWSRMSIAQTNAAWRQ